MSCLCSLVAIAASTSAMSLRRSSARDHDGLVLIAGGKEDGIASLRKRLSDLLELDGHLSKYHGQALWFRRSVEADAMAVALRAENPDGIVDGRFHTAPGMFSLIGSIPARACWLDNLPSDLSGSVADFCAGWGYLAAEILARAPEISKLDLYEADFDVSRSRQGQPCRHEPGNRKTIFLARPCRRTGDRTL